MQGGREKEKINILMNIENYFGEHTGSMKYTLYFLAASAAPILLYAMFLLPCIPFKWAIVVEVIWIARMALLFLGREDKKLEVYLRSVNDEYAVADDLVNVVFVHDDGLIEYANGSVCYIISGFCSTYAEDDDMAMDMEEFIKKLSIWQFDTMCHLVVDEDKLQNDMDNMSVYKDTEMMKERMAFYIEQDEACSKRTMLYRVNFAVHASKYDWKNLRVSLEELLYSSAANVFSKVYICDKEQAYDVCSRDLCMNINLEQMLLTKYKNDSFDGSKVLFYGDDVPEKYREPEEEVGLTDRRVSYFKNGEGDTSV